MRCQSLVLLVVAVASVSAYPNNLVKREDYVYDKNGNLKLTCKLDCAIADEVYGSKVLTFRPVSDERINLSGITIDNIADKLADVCSESGQCQTNEIEMDAKIPDRVLTIGPTGAYPTERREDLITALELAVNEVAECKDVKHKVDCPNPMVYCPGMFLWSCQNNKRSFAHSPNQTMIILWMNAWYPSTGESTTNRTTTTTTQLHRISESIWSSKWKIMVSARSLLQ